MFEKKQTVLRYSQFASSKQNHGGRRRSDQIRECLEEADCPIVEVDDTLLRRTPSRRKAFLRGLRLSFKCRGRLQVHPRYWTYLGGQFNRYYAFFRKCPEKVIIIEHTREPAIMFAAKTAGLHVIACPQNLESFCYDRDLLGAPYPRSLLNELYLLSLADCVFCISREEQWLLRLHGIDSEYFPYYPPRNILADLEQIRSKRESSTKEGFFILGSAVNPFTREGTRELLGWLYPFLDSLSQDIRVGGYGSEVLRDIYDHPRLHFLGPLSEEDLHGELVRCSAIIAHQKAGAGALTRVSEALIAGIPVIANPIAARGYMDGNVTVYETAAQLLSLLQKPMRQVVSPIGGELCATKFVSVVTSMF